MVKHKVGKSKGYAPAYAWPEGFDRSYLGMGNVIGEGLGDFQAEVALKFGAIDKHGGLERVVWPPKQPGNHQLDAWATNWDKEVHFTKALEEGNEDVYRWWFDRLVEGMGYELWNAVFDILRAGCFGAKDREAEKSANAAMAEFLERYRIVK